MRQGSLRQGVIGKISSARFVSRSEKQDAAVTRVRGSLWKQAGFKAAFSGVGRRCARTERRAMAMARNVFDRPERRCAVTCEDWHRKLFRLRRKRVRGKRAQRAMVRKGHCRAGRILAKQHRKFSRRRRDLRACRLIRRAAKKCRDISAPACHCKRCHRLQGNGQQNKPSDRIESGSAHVACI